MPDRARARYFVCILGTCLLFSGCTPSYTIVESADSGFKVISRENFNRKFGGDDEVVIVTVGKRELRAERLSIERDSVLFFDLERGYPTSLPADSISVIEDVSHVAGFFYGVPYGVVSGAASGLLLAYASEGCEPVGKQPSPCFVYPLGLGFYGMIVGAIVGTITGKTEEYRLQSARE